MKKSCCAFSLCFLVAYCLEGTNCQSKQFKNKNLKLHICVLYQKNPTNKRLEESKREIVSSLKELGKDLRLFYTHYFGYIYELIAAASSS